MTEIIEHWTSLNYGEKILDFNSMDIWYSSLIRIDKREVKRGIKEVRDLLNQDQTFLSHTAFVARYNIKTNYLECFKVISEHFTMNIKSTKL